MEQSAEVTERTHRKRLLIVAHAPSPNTQDVFTALIDGAGCTGALDVWAKAPFDVSAQDVLSANAVILMTPENFGYMSGALKDFFDRIYPQCLDRTRALPYALVIRAGQSMGMGCKNSVHSIVTGLGWRAVQEPLVLAGPYTPDFAAKAKELACAVAEGLSLGIF